MSTERTLNDLRDDMATLRSIYRMNHLPKYIRKITNNVIEVDYQLIRLEADEDSAIFAAYIAAGEKPLNKGVIIDFATYKEAHDAKPWWKRLPVLCSGSLG